MHVSTGKIKLWYFSVLEFFFFMLDRLIAWSLDHSRLPPSLTLSLSHGNRLLQVHAHTYTQAHAHRSQTSVRGLHLYCHLELMCGTCRGLMTAIWPEEWLLPLGELSFSLSRSGEGSGHHVPCWDTDVCEPHNTSQVTCHLFPACWSQTH